MYGKPMPFSNYHGRLYDATEITREALSWAMNLLARKRLIATKSGYLPWNSSSCYSPNRVCVIFGRHVHMMLRTTIVSLECYIQGAMRGEVAQDVEDGHFQVEQIRLHWTKPKLTRLI